MLRARSNTYLTLRSGSNVEQLSLYTALYTMGRGWKRPLRVCKSDVPEENLTLSLLLRSRTVVESKVRGLSFHLLYQRPFFVIVEANAGSRKLAKVTNTPKTTPGRPVCLSIEPQHYALKPGFWCELTSVYDSPTSSIKI